MNMFFHELRALRKSTIIWSLSLAALIIFMLSMFPAFSKDVADVKKLLANYPLSLRKAIGLSLDNFFTLLGFYSYLFLYVLLSGSIQAMNLGTSILSKEVREKTADFLLTKPVSRTQIITSKILAAFVSIVITNVIYLTLAFTAATIFKTEAFSVKTFFLISLSLFFIQLIFMALGLLVSVILPRVKSVLSISITTVFGFFVLNMLSSIIGDKAMRYIIPFKYFDTAYIIKNAAYETPFIIIGIAFVISAIGASYWIYIKKDIHAV